MIHVSVYPAFIATIISVVGLGKIYLDKHDGRNPQALSLLATNNKALARNFQAILVVCSILFTITMFSFVTPRISDQATTATAWSFTLACAILTAIFPYTGKTARIHAVFGKLMAFGMLLMAYAFAFGLGQPFNIVEGLLILAMSSLVLLNFIDEDTFIHCEIGYIFLSHISILVAVVALL